MSLKISNQIVRRLRTERGWTQEQLADLCGCSLKTIQRVEKSGLCSMETRSALASVFEIDLKQLDGEEKIQQAKKSNDDGLFFYHRLITGKQVVEVFDGTYAYRYSNEDARNQEDAGYIAEVVQTINDWSEIWHELEPGSKIKATYDIGELIVELEENGMLLFGLRTKTKFNLPTRDGKKKVIEGSVCNFHMAYTDSEEIIELESKQQ